MISFGSDYIAGAHPRIIEALTRTNLENLTGYGSDPYCDRAKEKIKAACKRDDAEVYFLVGGTQTNQLVISTVLENFEGAVAAKTGHVSTHEAGAIEYTGHKVLELPGKDGKLQAETLADYLKTFYADENHEHMVFPGMVYISYPTEYGTLYTKEELASLYEICKTYKMPLYIDGARLGYGLAASEDHMTLADFAALCDIFYIGGTKVGALCGEALVFTHGNAPKHFISQMKQHGALLAKGRLVGIQFDTLFTDGLYDEIGRYAIDMAMRLKKLFLEKGYPLFLDSPTNQQFIIMENQKLKELAGEVVYSFWEAYDEDHTVVRFATSWSTTDADLEALEALL